MMKPSLLLTALLFCSFFAAAQTNFSIQKTLVWSSGEAVSPAGRAFKVPNFEAAAFDQSHPSLPVFHQTFSVSGNGKLLVELAAATWEFFEKTPSPDDDFLTADLDFETQVARARGQWLGSVRFVPIRKNGSRFERLTSFELRVRLAPEPEPTAARGFKTTSVLSDGDIYKIGVNQSGVFKLTFDFLKNTLKINNLEAIDPRKIQLFGNGGGMLPEANAAARLDDLTENAIVVSGESDGKFDSGDFILFYAPGPDRWTFNAALTGVQFNVAKNLYDDHAYYFLKIGSENGLRVADRPSDFTATYTTSEGDDFKWLEEEKINLLDYAISAQGAGKRWFGDQFKNVRSKEYTTNFPFQNVVETEPARAKAVFAGRCGSASTVKLTVGDKILTSAVSAVSVADNEAYFASDAILSGSFTPASGFKVMIDYPQTASESEGFLDYIALQVRRSLTQPSGQNQMEFRDQKTIAQPSAIFKLNTSAAFEVWDISDPLTPVRQLTDADGSGIKFGCATSGFLRNFISFNKNDGFLTPDLAVGKIENQNLHSLNDLDLVIVFHKDFEAAAQNLADHRKTASGLAVEAVVVDKIYNEFGGGAADVTAIRDFARMLYERNSLKFKYLCVFGDGSFDYKNLRKDVSPSSFIPVFETLQSFSPISGFPSDDFFGLLDAGEGGNISTGLLDIGVGRITARTAEEAENVVQKIVDYDENPATLGDWRLHLIYGADDEDSNLHINQADKLADETEAKHRIYNPEKIFLDAYQQVSTAGDDRYPDAKAAINSAVFKGGLVLNWIGHGGPRGWAQERVIDNSDIESWDNPKKYPLLITATCSFGGFDDPTLTTGGEQALLKKNSGAVALFTTVRAVYIGPNNELTDAVADTIFSKTSGKNQALGLILSRAKNQLGGDENSRRFTLLGDPSMQLAIPDYDVVLTKINGKTVAASQFDTVKSLQKVELSGLVRDPSNGATLSDFNGILDVTFFDKKTTVKTLGNDPGSIVRSFTVRRNVLFKGKATVKNGLWTIKFVVPVDINYAFGKGKLSLYAQNGTPHDAAGVYENIVVGGTAAQPVVDDKPPVVQVFMNDANFVFGGLTNSEPKIFARISDDNGINVSGASIGHDLTAVIDGETANALILNDFYESAVDSAGAGKVLYPLSKLTVGRHSVRVKAWDIANHSGEGETEFVVAESATGALSHVLNYPNPFTTNTNFQFEHNLAGQLLNCQVQIFSVAGKLVKTLEAQLTPDGFRVTNLAWDGLDDYGDQLARGVYIYKIKVQTAGSGQKVKAESEFERLVILK